MLILAVLLTASVPEDSLPPLPDPTRVVFPEPPVFVAPQPGYLRLFGQAGGRWTAGCTLSAGGLLTGAAFDRHDVWSPCRTDAAFASYSSSMTHLLLRPAIRCFREALIDTTLLIQPMLDLDLIAPWFVTCGSIKSDRWKINGQDRVENRGKAGIVFDRAAYLPSLDISVLQYGAAVRSCWTGSIHINRLHAGVGSPVFYGFPSPRLFMAYRQPVLKFEASVKSGIDLKSLDDLYRPDRPFHLPFPVPDESLKIRADLDCTFDYIRQRLELGMTYRNNKTRLAVQEDMSYGTIGMIEETTVFIKAENNLARGIFAGQNLLTGRYARTSLPLLYQPRLELDDQVWLRCGPVFLRAAVSLMLHREGASGSLPDLFILELRQCGFAGRWFSVYVAVYNATDARDDLYDGYGLAPRSYAGGMTVNFWF